MMITMTTTMTIAGHTMTTTSMCGATSGTGAAEPYDDWNRGDHVVTVRPICMSPRGYVNRVDGNYVEAADRYGREVSGDRRYVPLDAR